MRVNVLANTTSWDADAEALIPGGQLDRFYRPVLDVFDRTGVEYVVTRDPVEADVGLWPNGLDRYPRGSERLHRVRVGVSHGCGDKNYLASKHGQYDHLIVPGPAYVHKLVRAGCSGRHFGRRNPRHC